MFHNTYQLIKARVKICAHVLFWPGSSIRLFSFGDFNFFAVAFFLDIFFFNGSLRFPWFQVAVCQTTHQRGTPSSLSFGYYALSFSSRRQSWTNLAKDVFFSLQSLFRGFEWMIVNFRNIFIRFWRCCYRCFAKSKCREETVSPNDRCSLLGLETGWWQFQVHTRCIPPTSCSSDSPATDGFRLLLLGFVNPWALSHSLAPIPPDPSLPPSPISFSRMFPSRMSRLVVTPAFIRSSKKAFIRMDCNVPSSFHGRIFTKLLEAGGCSTKIRKDIARIFSVFSSRTDSSVA